MKLLIYLLILGLCGCSPKIEQGDEYGQGEFQIRDNANFKIRIDEYPENNKKLRDLLKDNDIDHFIAFMTYDELLNWKYQDKPEEKERACGLIKLWNPSVPMIQMQKRTHNQERTCSMLSCLLLK